MTTASLRATIRATNTVGHVLRRAGVPLVSLDEQDLLATARRETGFDDFGDDRFREALRLVLRGLETEARLTPLGRIMARSDIVRLLANRLRLHEDWKRHPGIAAEEIRQPLFVLGLPRTGSTLLHHLLAQDQASRVTQAWEVMYPSPPPTRDRYESDRRIAWAARQLRWFDAMAPRFKSIHPLGPRLALECIAITSLAFLSPRFYTMYRLPSYEGWLDGQDLRPAYAFHRRFLQHLQWRAPADGWVLKAPMHVFAVDALLETYPDAGIIQTHRDPLTVLASVASLHAALQGAFAEAVDTAEIGRDVTRRWIDGFDRAVELRRAARVAPQRYLDVHYHELTRDPIGTVRRIYERFNRPLSATAEARMRRFLVENPKNKHGRHQYSLEMFGLDADELRGRCKTYCEYFGVPAEPGPGQGS